MGVGDGRKGVQYVVSMDSRGRWGREGAGVVREGVGAGVEERLGCLQCSSDVLVDC